MDCLRLSYYDNERVGLTVVRAGAGVNEKIARPDVTAAASFFRSGQQHTTVLNFLLLFGASQKVGIVDENSILHNQQTSSFTYEYHLRDHLGSVRVAFEPTTSGNEVKQINAYYPFGAPIAALSFNPLTSTNRYKHTGMETIEDFGLGYVDNGMRWRGSPFAPGFRTRDPLAAKYPHLSPYIYCNNNPINAIDPSGMATYLLFGDGRMVLAIADVTKEDKKRPDIIYTAKTNKTESVKVNDKNFLPQLAANPDAESYNATTLNSTDAFNVFHFAAKNSDVEWSLSGYKENGKTKFYLNTKHSTEEANMGYGKGGFFNERDILFNVHSHSRENSDKGGSGYMYDDYNPKTGKWNFSGYSGFLGSDGIPAAHLYKTTGRIIPTYVYHRYTQGLYKYTPWKKAAKKWLNIESGSELKNIIYP